MKTTFVINNAEHFNNEQLAVIGYEAGRMFGSGPVEQHLRVGGHDVCLKRVGLKVTIHKMADTLERNDKLVTRSNKRK